MRIRLGGRGYAPAADCLLQKHSKGLSEFTDLMLKLQTIIEEDLDVKWVILYKLKKSLCFSHFSEDFHTWICNMYGILDHPKAVNLTYVYLLKSDQILYNFYTGDQNARIFLFIIGEGRAMSALRWQGLDKNLCIISIKVLI